MKIPATYSFAVVCLLLVFGSFSSVSGFYPQPNYLEKMRNFIEGERWANFFNSMRAMDLPPTLTIFWPTGEDVSMIPDQWAMEPNVVLYHIVPGKLSYWQLSRLAAAGERIPTLLPYNSIILTADKSCNVSVNHIQITNPEKFQNGAVIVHGVSTPLNYFLYGDQTMPSEGASLPQKYATSAISLQSLPLPSQPVAPTPKPSPPSTYSAPTPQPHSQHAAPTLKPSPPSKVDATSAAPTPQPSPQPVAPTPKSSPHSKVNATSVAPTPQPSPPSKLNTKSAAPSYQPSPPSKVDARPASPAPQPSPPLKLNATSAAPTPQPSPPSKLNATSTAPTSLPSKLNVTSTAPTPQPSPPSEHNAISAAPTPQPSKKSQLRS